MATLPTWPQDIIGLPRASHTADQYTDAAGRRMVQDFRRCSSSCLVTVGGVRQPKDMTNALSGAAARNFTALPYGQWGDYYINR